MPRFLFTSALSFFLLTASLYAQALPELIPYRKGDKWGYADSTKKIIVPCRFTKVRPLRNGYAAVFTGNKYGFIDSTGKIYHEAEFEFDDHESNGTFEGNYMPVIKNGKTGLIHKNGKWVIQPVYDFLYFLEPDQLLARKGTTAGYLDTTGKVVFPFIYEHVGEDCNGLYVVKKGKKYGLADISGKLVVPLKYDHMNSWRDGMLIVAMDSLPEKNSYYSASKGYLDSTGKEIHPCTLKRAGSFSEGFAAVAPSDKYGFIDKKGNYVVPCIYDRVSAFSCGRACVTKDGKYGYVNRTGKEVIPRIYSTWNVILNYGKSFEDNIVVVEMDKGKTCGIIDTNGKEVVPCVYTGIWWQHECGFYLLSYGKERSDHEIYYPHGKLVKAMDSRDPCYFPGGVHHVSCAKFDSVYCYVTMDGDTLNNKLYRKRGNATRFNDLNFSEGLGIIIEDGKAGYIDVKGRTVIPCKYVEATAFHNGLAFVKGAAMRTVSGRHAFKTNALGYIDRYGTEYWEE